MKCAVCGKDVGFWAKLGKHTQICKSCSEQGQNRLKVLANSVGWVTNWQQEQADRWLAQYDEIVHKYQVPNVDALRARNEILNRIFKLVESKEQMADADLEYLVGLGQRFAIAESGSPELRDTVLRIALRQAIQSWDRGKPLEKECSALVLAKGEVCHWEEPAGLLIQRTRREYIGGYGSVSIPLHIVRGARVRVGGFKGVPIDKTVHEDGGRGILHITNQRVCFTGLNQAVAIPFKKIVSLAGLDEGLEVHTGNEKKPGIFLVPHPELTAELLKRASSSQGDDDSRPKRRRKVPTLTMVILAVLLSAATLLAGQNTPPSGESDKSLGDIARKVRPKDAKITTQHVFTDDDVKHSSSGPAIPDPKGTVADYRKATETYLQATAAYLTDLQDKTPRQLGEIVAKDIQFPGRDNWETRLAASRDSLVAKTQAAIFTVRREESLLEGNDLNRAKEAQTVVNDQLLHIRLARQDFEHVLSEGATAAGDWERKPR